MTDASKSKATLKLNPVRGHLPVLQYALPSQLNIDPEYQRSAENAKSRALINRIARDWDWALCQPLAVARRPDSGDLFVIDGQHRLIAARLRGDIHQLPCVIGEYGAPGEEAAAFVALNQQRKPLSNIDIFRAALASGNPEACDIERSLTDAGLSIAAHSNPDRWKPGQLLNITSITEAWRAHGAMRTRLALNALAAGFAGQVLRYAGTIFPGIVAIIADETSDMTAVQIRDWACSGSPNLLADMLSGSTQDEWRDDIIRHHAAHPGLSRQKCGRATLLAAWQDYLTALFDDDESQSEATA